MAALDNKKSKATATAPTEVATSNGMSDNYIPMPNDLPQFLPASFANLTPITSEEQINQMAADLAQLQLTQKLTVKGDNMREKAVDICVQLVKSRIPHLQYMAQAVMKQVGAGVEMKAIMAALPEMKALLEGTVDQKKEQRVSGYRDRLNAAMNKSKDPKETAKATN